MKNVFFFLSISALLILTACDKDQKAVKMLDGTWELSAVNGFPIPVNSEAYHTYTFSNCKLKDNEYCDVVYTDNSETWNFLYNVSGKGTVMTVKSGNEVRSFTIVELEKEKFITTTVLEGNTITFSYKKL